MTELESRLSFDRVVAIMNRVQERLNRTVAALRGAGIPFAIAGGNAVATWVATMDKDAIRQTNDVDILVQRDDLPRIKAAMEAAGVHLLFAGEMISLKHITPAPDLSERVVVADQDILKLEALVRMKLNANRDKDRMHLRDFIAVGLLDQSWVQRYPPELGTRLQHLFDTPGG